PAPPRRATPPRTRRRCPDSPAPSPAPRPWPPPPERAIPSPCLRSPAAPPRSISICPSDPPSDLSCQAGADAIPCLANIYYRKTMRNGCQSMTEAPSSIRRSARRLRLATLFAIALAELAILFSAWVLIAGRPQDLPWLGIEAGGLPPVPAAIVL